MISDHFFAELPHMDNADNSTALATSDGVSVLTAQGLRLMNKLIFEPYLISNRTKIVFKDDRNKPQSLMAIILKYKDENSADLSLYFKSTRVGSAQESCCETKKNKALGKMKRGNSEIEFRNDLPEKSCD